MRNIARFILALFPALTGLSAQAQTSVISPDQVVQAEVLAGWQTPSGTRMAALRLHLADDWHTYWRSPGDAGIPPRFDWDGSGNLASVTFHWPRPSVFDLNGMQSLGYVHDLVLPIELTAKDPSKPIALQGTVELGVCKDICMPVTLHMAANLTAPGATDPAIASALGKVPESAKDAGLSKATCAVSPIPDGVRLTATLDLPAQGPEETAVFELPDRNIWISQATSSRKGGRLTATADFVPPGGTAFALNRSDLTITVIGASNAVEVRGCPAG